MHMPPVPGSVPLTDTRLWLCFDLMLCVAFGAKRQVALCFKELLSTLLDTRGPLLE